MINISGDPDAARVVITGMGSVTALGLGVEPLWENLLAAKSGVSLIDSFDTSAFTTKIAAQIRGFTPEDYMDRKEARRMDPFVQYAVAATRLAMSDSGLVITVENADRV